jgi:hypothetical protein
MAQKHNFVQSLLLQCQPHISVSLVNCLFPVFTWLHFRFCSSLTLFFFFFFFIIIFLFFYFFVKVCLYIGYSSLRLRAGWRLSLKLLFIKKIWKNILEKCFIFKLLPQHNVRLFFLLFFKCYTLNFSKLPLFKSIFIQLIIDPLVKF